MITVNRPALVQTLSNLLLLANSNAKIESERMVVIAPSEEHQLINFFVRTTEGHLALCMRENVEISNQQYVGACIDLKKFWSALRTMRGETVSLTAKGSKDKRGRLSGYIGAPNITAKSGRSSATFVGIRAPMEYMSVNKWRDNNSTAVSTEAFCQGVAKVSKVATSQMKGRNTSTYVAVHAKESIFDMAATNSAMAIYTEIGCSPSVENEWDRVHVSMKALRVLERLCKRMNGDVAYFCKTGTMLLCQMEGFRLDMPLIDAKPPQYEPILNAHLPISVEANVVDLDEALKLMEIQSEGSRSIANWYISDDKLKMSTASSMGAGNKEIDVSYSGEGKPETFAVSVNPSLVRTGLSVLARESVMMHMEAPLRPIRAKEGNTTFIVLPMRPMERSM